MKPHDDISQPIAAHLSVPQAKLGAAAATIIAALALLLAAAFQPVRVKGESMAPTFHDGDVAIAFLWRQGPTKHPVIAEITTSQHRNLLVLKRPCPECADVPEGHIYLHSDRYTATANSHRPDPPGIHYDSRCFGPVEQSQIKGRIIGSSSILRPIFAEGPRNEKPDHRRPRCRPFNAGATAAENGRIP